MSSILFFFLISFWCLVLPLQDYLYYFFFWTTTRTFIAEKETPKGITQGQYKYWNTEGELIARRLNQCPYANLVNRNEESLTTKSWKILPWSSYHKVDYDTKSKNEQNKQKNTENSSSEKTATKAQLL
jgi:hypothetical protein